MIEMPSDMNGLLKSMTRSRSDVIVIGAIAISASCKRRKKKLLVVFPRFQIYGADGLFNVRMQYVTNFYRFQEL